MKEYDGKVNFGALGERLRQEGYEYAHLEEVYMKVFDKPVPESRKPTIKENGREIYYPEQDSPSYQHEHCDIPLNSSEPELNADPIQDVLLQSQEHCENTSSCQQNKEWFQRKFYTDYNCTSKRGKEWQAKRAERLRTYLNEHDACIRCKGSQS